LLESRAVRIAVSGTHCSGKSTLVEDFLTAHPDYVHEPEPYEWLDGEPFAEEPDPADFYRQLELSVERLRGYGPGARVIAERSPVDFLAYILALDDLRRGGRPSELIEPATALAARGLEHLDLLVILPLDESAGILAPESEDPELREAMNDRLVEIVTTDAFDLLGGGRLQIIDVYGTPSRRLSMVNRVVR
jgi:hypothetical protein